MKTAVNAQPAPAICPPRFPALRPQACAGLIAALALGGCYRVDTTADAPDANPGDGVCARALTLAETRRGVLAPRAAPELGRLQARLAASKLTPQQKARLAAGDLTAADRATLVALRADALALLRRTAGNGPGTLADLPPKLCTLRAAVMEANAHAWKSYITVPAGTYRLTRPYAAGGAGGSLLVTGSMRIQGSGAGATVVDAEVPSSVFTLDPPANTTDIEINHLTLRGGDNGQFGGGLWVQRGAVELEDLVVEDNFGFTGGGGMLVNEHATVYVRRSVFRDNLAQGAFGGAVLNFGRLWVYDSTFVGNQSNRAGAIHNNPQGQMNLRNVTVSGNRADVDDPAGASGVGGIQQNGFAVLYNVTITNNEGTADRGGGLATLPGKITVLKNSILAGNHSNGGADDCLGPLSGDSKYNLIGDSTGCEISSYLSTFILDQGAQLGPLTANGGPTPTHKPGATSLARNAGYQFPQPAADGCEPRDQRGVPRHHAGDRCDLGAVETAGANLDVTGFMLVDAATDTDIRPLRHDDWLLLGELPAQLSVRATVAGAAGSVVFGFDGNPGYRTENTAPYALGGDASGDYAAVPLAGGPHTLTATPYAAAGGGGAVGASRTIRFNVFAAP